MSWSKVIVAPASAALIKFCNSVKVPAVYTKLPATVWSASMPLAVTA